VRAEVPTSPKSLAKHNGRCPACNAAIRKDEAIVEVLATKEWVHPECIPVEPSKTTTEAGLTASDRSRSMTPTAVEDDTLRAFHGDQGTKDKLLERIGAHEQADAIARGFYWEQDEDEGDYRGCAVGCSLHDPGQAPLNRDGEGLHALYPERLGLPEWLAHLEDRLFEGMPAEAAMTWPRRFAEAIPVGADFDGLADRLAIRRLKEECLPLSGHWPESVKARVVASIEQTIAALEGKGDREAAWSAAWSAESAAWSAESAESAYQRDADRLIAELEVLPVTGVEAE